MKRALIGSFALLILMFLAGCGGGGGNQRGVVTGNVSDLQGNPIVDALVSADGTRVSTRSTQQGIYRLEDVPEGYRIIEAEITIDGVDWYGQNVAQLIVDEIGNQAKSVNITMAPEGDLGSIDGFVYNPNGLPLEGARVFAVSDRELSAATTVTDRNGYYRIDALIDDQNVSYQVTASAQGYENDTTTNVSINAGQTRRFSFTLQNTTNPGLNPPTGVTATSWTVPQDSVRSPNARVKQAYEAIKARLDPKRKTAKRAASATRITPSGSYIEIDLSWNFIDDPAVLGYGIFRGTETNRINAIDFLRDPLANFYADQDRALTPNQRYYYQMTVLNTDYPDSPGSSSDRSAIVSAQPLPPFGDLSSNPGSDRLSWDAVPGAASYRVLVYSIFPDWNVKPVIDITTNSTSLDYNGALLTNGNRYYWVVTAYSEFVGDRYINRSVSTIEDFIAQ